MKKWIALALALVLMLSMGVTAMADEVEDETIPVFVNVVLPGDEVYAVRLDWESMEFTYTFGKWNATNRNYDGGSWNKQEATISVFNSSNVDLRVTGSVGNGQHTVAGVTVDLENKTFVLPMPAVNAAATSNTMTVKIGGAPTTQAAAANQNIGIITVQFAKN